MSVSSALKVPLPASRQEWHEHLAAGRCHVGTAELQSVPQAHAIEVNLSQAAPIRMTTPPSRFLLAIGMDDRVRMESAIFAAADLGGELAFCKR